MEQLLYRFALVFSLLILSSRSADTTGTVEHLDYTEKDWPDTCKGNRQSPISFPDQATTNNTYLPVNGTKILFNTYKLVSGISMYQSVGDAKFAFKTGDMGELYIQKNGLFYKYILNELHFHARSEHNFNGTAYDLEMHLVHSKDNQFFFSANGNSTNDPDLQQQKLVVGILFVKNDNKTNLNSNINNTFIQNLKLWNATAVVNNFTLNDFSRADKFFLHYEGSLTTPGCNEFVNWFVMTQLESITSDQLNEFLSFLKAKGYPDGNYRKARPLNNRKIYYNDYTTFSPLIQLASSNFLYITNIAMILLLVAIF